MELPNDLLYLYSNGKWYPDSQISLRAIPAKTGCSLFPKVRSAKSDWPWESSSNAARCALNKHQRHGKPESQITTT